VRRVPDATVAGASSRGTFRSQFRYSEKYIHCWPCFKLSSLATQIFKWFSNLTYDLKHKKFKSQGLGPLKWERREKKLTQFSKT
jgi:hypothetical protein